MHTVKKYRYLSLIELYKCKILSKGQIPSFMKRPIDQKRSVDLPMMRFPLLAYSLVMPKRMTQLAMICRSKYSCLAFQLVLTHAMKTKIRSSSKATYRLNQSVVWITCRIPRANPKDSSESLQGAIHIEQHDQSRITSW